LDKLKEFNMGLIIENNQDAVVESVLLTTEKIFIDPKASERPDTIKVNEVVYFEIED
jgi:hypothetical protein